MFGAVHVSEIPRDVRAQVIERDHSCCRVCGRYTDTPGLHHIKYRSEGGGHTPDNLITIGWTPGHDCHISIVHANKALWQPILQIVVASPAHVTAFAVKRWQQTRL